MTELCDLSAIELRWLIGAKKASPVEVLASCMGRIAKVNPALNAIVAIDEARAKKEAKAAEAAVMAGDDLGPLHGLPVGIKDTTATAGLRTTYGSPIYADNVPAADERVVAVLRKAGAIAFCKTNTPEFAAGANTTNKVYGPTGNPFAPELTCGGSTGGGAVGLATGMIALATGTDFGGSLRTPAAFCGVTGFRPTPGAVPSETRPIGQAPLSVHGPMGRTVADAALLLSCMVGADPCDPYNWGPDPALAQPLRAADLSHLRVAVSADFGGIAPLDDGIRRVFQDRVERFSGLFRSCEARDPEFGPDAHRIFEVLRGVIFIAAHGERLAKHRDQLGPNVIDNTERGLKFTAADIAWAHVEQTKLYRRFLKMFDEIDLLICPGASVSPFPHAQNSVGEINGRKMETYMRWLTLTYGLTLATPPVAAIPCGRDRNGLPFGLQVVGRPRADRFVLEAAHALELAFAADPALARPLPDLGKLAR